MTLAPLGDEARQRLGLDPDARGLLVTAIDDASDAFSKGLREGDLIVEVGQEPVATPADMKDRVDAAEAAGRNSILLLVRRDGQPRFVALNLSN
jgi:serine protease Do